MNIFTHPWDNIAVDQRRDFSEVSRSSFITQLKQYFTLFIRASQFQMLEHVVLNVFRCYVLSASVLRNTEYYSWVSCGVWGVWNEWAQQHEPKIISLLIRSKAGESVRGYQLASGLGHISAPLGLSELSGYPLLWQCSPRCFIHMKVWAGNYELLTAGLMSSFLCFYL